MIHHIQVCGINIPLKDEAMLELAEAIETYAPETSPPDLLPSLLATAADLRSVVARSRLAVVES